VPQIDVQLVPGPVREDDAPIPSSCVVDGRAGGEVVFLGRTRAEHDPMLGKLRSLAYEAYEPMAVEVIRRIACDAAERFACGFVGVRHSTGIVPVGEASVLIRVAAAHRAAAFDACRCIIDRLKTEAPIWKKDMWTAASRWQEGTPVAVQEPRT